MKILEKWFNQAKLNTRVFKDKNSSFVIYKGFKIRKSDKKYSILDTRLRDLYSKIRDKDLIVINKYGFIRGVDLLSYERNVRRSYYYKRRTEKYYTIRDSLIKNDKDYNNKLNNCNNNIYKNIGLIFFYNSKIHQFKSKYKNYNNTLFIRDVEIINNKLNNKYRNYGNNK